MHSATLRLSLFSILFCLLAAEQRSVDAQSDLSAALSLEEALISTIEDCEESVVSIARIRPDKNPNPPLRVNPFGFPNRRDQQRPNAEDPESPDFVPNEFGAGVILTLEDDPNSRYILTNYHIVKGGPVVGQQGAGESRLYIRFSTGHGYFASIRAADPRSDLAVLEIDFEQLKLTPDKLKPLKFAKDHRLRKGQLVIGLGNPLAIARDGSASASWGMISNIARSPKPPPDAETATAVPDETIHHTGTLIQLDMKLNLGTSGGALLNLQGEFVGLTTSLAALEGYETSAGFAIPADERFQRIFETLAKGQEVEYGFLGVGPQDVTPREVSLRNLPIGQASAPMLFQVFQNSPAGRAGMRRGDLVLQIGKKRTLSRRDLMREVSLNAPESQVPIRIWRPETSRTMNLSVMLGKWPAQNDEEIIETSPRFDPWRGLRLDYPTGRFRFMTRSFAYPDAVLISKIDEQTPASESELQAGEFISALNGRPVRSPHEFQVVANDLKGPVVLQLTDGREITLPEAVAKPAE